VSNSSLEFFWLVAVTPTVMDEVSVANRAMTTGIVIEARPKRRLGQAEDALERAVEVVDFQGVGMQLRECMISLMASARRSTELPADAEEPQAANVAAWSELLFNHYCPGSSNDKLRGYLKATTDKAWQLVNQLTHHRNANRTAALVAKRAVDTIVVHMANILTRELWDRTGQCPRCESRLVRKFFDREIAPDGAYFEDCSECDWNSHPGHEVVDFDDLGLGGDGDCANSHRHRPGSSIEFCKGCDSSYDRSGLDDEPRVDRQF
jgi:hypothetical protein